MTAPQEDAPWFERAFEAAYLDVYPHRDDASAAAEIAWIAAQLDLGPQAAVLDVGCGAGRHAAAWSARGTTVVGVDLSRDLLARARGRGLANAAFLRADMRALPFGPCFDVVTSLFTSFGYFEDDDDDRRVIEGMARALLPDGVLIVDFLDAGHVRATLVPEDVRRIGDTEIVQRRRITADGRRVEKTVAISGPGGERRHVESVRLLELDDFRALYAAADLELIATHDGLGAEAATPRLVTFARRRTS